MFRKKREINRLIYLLIIGLMSCSINSDNEKADKRPNILWIVADDLGTDLGCYGDSLVYTPNLDKLAREGVRYVNFYTVAAVCSPSRSTLITGMYPVSIEAHQHRTRYKKPLPEGIEPITKYFREAGYFTCNGDFRNSENPGKTDYNFVADSIFDGTDWSQREDGQPFFAQVQIFYPHRPFLRDTLHPVDQARVKLAPYYPDHWITKQDWALYLETIQILDREVGKVIQRLEDENLSENTVVFFFGDQGRPMVRAKQFMYDGGIHSPLIMHENDELTQIQDIFMANNRPAEELYDLNQDPWEVHNLSGKEDYEDTLLHLRSLMDSVLLKYDKGIYPETEEEIEFAEKLIRDRFKKQMENKGLSEKSADEEILEYRKGFLTPTPLRK